MRNPISPIISATKGDKTIKSLHIRHNGYAGPRAARVVLIYEETQASSPPRAPLSLALLHDTSPLSRSLASSSPVQHTLTCPSNHPSHFLYNHPTMHLSISCLLVSLVGLAQAVSYRRTDNVVGEEFDDFFEYQAIPDPTFGRVTYVDRTTAVAQNLTFAKDNTFILRADGKQVLLDPSGPGRNSVRIRSRKTFTTHVVVFDVRHMPEGCGTWPAVWETQEEGWPVGGEVDIIEGVNNIGTNAATLHTSPGCSIHDSAKAGMTGTFKQQDCNWLVNGNAGCGALMRDQLSFGPSFNANGGGHFAFERTPRYMKVWFWPRSAGNVPRDLGTQYVNPDTWGIPAVFFPDTSCDFEKMFSAHHIIINLSLCGEWAGHPAIYPASCPLTCVEHVNKNPTAFKNAFWDFKAIDIYQRDTRVCKNKSKRSAM